MFVDGSIIPFVTKPDMSHFSEGVCFEVNENLPVLELCEMASLNWDYERFPQRLMDKVSVVWVK